MRAHARACVCACVLWTKESWCLTSGRWRTLFLHCCHGTLTQARKMWGMPAASGILWSGSIGHGCLKCVHCSPATLQEVSRTFLCKPAVRSNLQSDCDCICVPEWAFGECPHPKLQMDLLCRKILRRSAGAASCWMKLTASKTGGATRRRLCLPCKPSEWTGLC